MKNKITSHFEFLLLFDRVKTYSISVQYMHNYVWCIWEVTLTQSTLTQSPRGSVSGGGHGYLSGIASPSSGSFKQTTSENVNTSRRIPAFRHPSRSIQLP